MPIENITAPEAVNYFRQNPFSRYPRPDMARQRFLPYPIPESRPSFCIRREDTVFTIGSCFAAEIERALQFMGFETVSRTAAFHTERSWYNKYTIHSILNEIRWALDPNCPYPGKNALLEIPKKGWTDPQINRKFVTETLEDMLEFRARYHQSMHKICQADVIILTLGLAEAWYDNVTGLYLNNIPPQYHINKTPERFELRVLSYDDILEALEEIYALIKQFCKPSVKFLITVSPIPLNATFRAQDVFVANCYSKCVQRAAVEVFVQQHDNVDYFPSYEFATIQGLEYDEKRDFRHITPKAVSRIMMHVLSRYLDETDANSIKLAVSAEYLWTQQDYRKIIQLAQNTTLSSLPAPVLHFVGRAYKKLGDPVNALKTYLQWHKRQKKSRQALKSAITAAIDIRRYTLAKRLIKKHRTTFTFDPKFEQKLNHMLSLKQKIWRIIKIPYRHFFSKKSA